MKTKNLGVIGVKDGWSSLQLRDAVARKTGSGHLIDLSEVTFDLTTGKVHHRELDLLSLDALIVKKLGAVYSPDLLERLEILEFLEQRGLQIYSRTASLRRAVDRLAGTLRLRLGNIPIPPTTITEDIEQAEQAIAEYKTAVLKPLYTSKARGMMLVHSDNGMRNTLNQFLAAGNTIMYIQKKLNISGRDLGVVFLGGEYLATYARVAEPESWHTTTHSGGKYEAYSPEPSVIELAEKAQALFGLDFTCVDIALTDIGPVVFEVSAFGGFRGLREANGIDAADRYVDYVLGRLEK